MRNRILTIICALLAAGCASREPMFAVAAPAAERRAADIGRPILVLSLVGDLKGKL